MAASLKIVSQSVALEAVCSVHVFLYSAMKIKQ
jgi:hypothetical protein